MLFFLASIVFLIMAIVTAVRPSDGNRFDIYFFFLIGLSVLAASFPIRHMLFEMKLAKAAGALINNPEVVVDCNSYFDSMFHLGAAGFVYRGSSKINLEVRTCDAMEDYLADPERAKFQELYALHTLTHEAMHVAGTIDEVRTDCQAFQRNHRMAELLGVAPKVARVNAQIRHRLRLERHPYYSAECEPGGALDENLPDAVWLAP